MGGEAANYYIRLYQPIDFLCWFEINCFIFIRLRLSIYGVSIQHSGGLADGFGR